MQYAILTNNIELAKLLHSKGASYEYIYMVMKQIIIGD